MVGSEGVVFGSGASIKINIIGKGFEDMDWFRVAQDTGLWDAVVYTVKNTVSIYIFLSCGASTRFLSWPPLTGLRDHTQTHHAR